MFVAVPSCVQAMVLVQLFPFCVDTRLVLASVDTYCDAFNAEASNNGAKPKFPLASLVNAPMPLAMDDNRLFASACNSVLAVNDWLVMPLVTVKTEIVAWPLMA